MPCRNHPEEVFGLVRCSRCGEEFCRDCVVEMGGDQYCAGCKAEHVRDIKSGVSDTDLEIASLGRRLGAAMLDYLVLVTAATIVAAPFFFLGLDRGPSAPPETAFLVLIVLLYAVILAAAVTYVALMHAWRGQTLGKMAVKIKVVTPEGDDISAGQAWLRAVLQILLALPYGLTFLTAVFTKERKAIHDLIARTRVVNWRP